METFPKRRKQRTGYKLEIKPTKQDEIKIMTALSKAAFDTDILVGAPEMGGPPDYDSEPWHEKMRAKGHLYTIYWEDRPIGGAVLFPNAGEKSIYLGRIFLDPEVQGRGLGLEAMDCLEKLFPEMELWCLDTPVWNVRTNPFYRKAGYREVSRDQESVGYQKRIQRRFLL